MQLVVFTALHFELNALPAGEATGHPQSLQTLLELVKTGQVAPLLTVQAGARHLEAPLPQITLSDCMVRYLDQLSDTMHGNGAPGYTLDSVNIELLTEYQEKQTTTADTGTPSTTTMMIIRNEVMLYPNIHKHSLRQLAKKHFINEKSLSRMFSKTFGVKISDFILEQVMKRARYLLENTEMTVADIAEELGYSNDYNFSRTFKNMYGTYPADLRRQNASQL